MNCWLLFCLLIHVQGHPGLEVSDDNFIPPESYLRTNISTQDGKDEMTTRPDETTTQNDLVEETTFYLANDLVGNENQSKNHNLLFNYSIDDPVENEENKNILLSELIDKLSDMQNEEVQYVLERKLNGHSCKRDCSNSSAMICKYYFKLEDYRSMSKACYNCPYNITACYDTDCIPSDGVQKSLKVVNRELPGPSDTIIVDVVNSFMDSSTTIHWHGQHQLSSPFMDGVPMITQCPILPLNTFRYKFIAQNPGTHFWHSHSGTQRADGAFGALIVKRKNEPQKYLYDQDLSEHIIQIMDWSHDVGTSLFTAHHHSNGTNKPDTIQVNGRGEYQNFIKGGKTIKTPLSTFTVQKGLRYRFRLINAGILNCPIEMKIDNHTLLVISSDGSDFKPVEVESLVSYAGERWDFVVKAGAPQDNYWMRFRGLMDCDERFTSAHTGAVLHYTGAPLIQPKNKLIYNFSVEGKTLNPLNKPCDTGFCVTKLKSVTESDKKYTKEPGKQFVFSYDFYPIDNPSFNREGFYSFHQVLRKSERLYTPQLNHVSLRLPSFPLLTQYENIKPGMFCNRSQMASCKKNFCECTNVINASLGELVEIILIDLGNTFDANHPFHLHGHPFAVVGMGKLGSNTTVDQVLSRDKAGLIKRNLAKPIIKDTVTVPDGGYTIIRFVANNPGYWLFHCHIEFHVELGMAVIFKVGEHKDFIKLPKNFPKCGNFYPDVPEANVLSLLEQWLGFTNSSKYLNPSLYLLLLTIGLISKDNI